MMKLQLAMTTIFALAFSANVTAVGVKSQVEVEKKLEMQESTEKAMEQAQKERQAAKERADEAKVRAERAKKRAEQAKTQAQMSSEQKAKIAEEEMEQRMKADVEVDPEAEVNIEDEK